MVRVPLEIETRGGVISLRFDFRRHILLCISNLNWWRRHWFIFVSWNRCRGYKDEFKFDPDKVKPV